MLFQDENNGEDELSEGSYDEEFPWSHTGGSLLEDQMNQMEEFLEDYLLFQAKDNGPGHAKTFDFWIERLKKIVE